MSSSRKTPVISEDQRLLAVHDRRSGLKHFAGLIAVRRRFAEASAGEVIDAPNRSFADGPAKPLPTYISQSRRRPGVLPVLPIAPFQ